MSSRSGRLTFFFQTESITRAKYDRSSSLNSSTRLSGMVLLRKCCTSCRVRSVGVEMILNSVPSPGLGIGRTKSFNTKRAVRTSSELLLQSVSTPQLPTNLLNSCLFHYFFANFQPINEVVAARHG